MELSLLIRISALLASWLDNGLLLSNPQFICCNISMPPTKFRWASAIAGFLKQAKAPKESVKFVGEDYLGNKYYEAQKANAKKYRYHHKKVQPSKYSDPIDLVSNVPPAWQSWLRYTRQDPPTPEEIKESEDYYEYQQSMAKSKQEGHKPDDNMSFERKSPKVPNSR